MKKKVDDICTAHRATGTMATVPVSPPIYMTSVWQCTDPEQAGKLLAGEESGYVYQRDRHPNADMLQQTCTELHGAKHATVSAAGMSSLAVVMLALLQKGDLVAVSSRLYGRSLKMLTADAERLGIESIVVDICDPEAVSRALSKQPKLLVVETISNPMLRIADLASLAEKAHQAGARLVVDNTFASPYLCRPLELGADVVLESMSKIMNGHSDVMLGLLCGNDDEIWSAIDYYNSGWGFASNAMDCWLAARGLSTLHLRADRACQNAQSAATLLASHPAVETVCYPGLEHHPDFELARRMFGGAHFGWMVTFSLREAEFEQASQFVRQAGLPFCPSLGEVATTLSHPSSTSHRGLSQAEQQELGITPATIRLSLGCESTDYVVDSLNGALADFR